MKYRLLLTCVLAVAITLTACHKNNNPVPPTKDSTLAPADSATGMAVVTYAVDNTGAVVNTLLFLNPDGTLKWKFDQFHGEAVQAPGYAGGALFVSTSYYGYNSTTRQTISYGKMYALNATDGSVIWSYLDSSYSSAVPIAANGEVYLPQYLVIQGFDTKTGSPNWGMGVADGLPWTPLIVGDTLYTATAPLYTGYYSIVAIDIKQRKAVWTTPIGYNPPGGVTVADGKVVFTIGAGALMALDKNTGVKLWTVSDQQYDGMHVASGSTLFAFNHTTPLGLYAFSLATGGQIWQAKLPKIPNQFGGLWMYGKYVCFYAYQYPTSYLQTVDPQTGDSVARATVNNRYESPLLVGHRIYASKTWDNSTNRSLATPQVVVLDAGTLAVKDSVVLTGIQQVKSMRVIGKSGTIY